MNSRIIFIGFTLLGLVVSCREGFLVHISQIPESSPVMRFEAVGLLSRNIVELRQLAVGRVVAQGKPVELVWLIRAKSENPSRIAEVVYGLTPAEFEELIPARPLLVGEVYDVAASSSGGVGGARFAKE